MNKSMLDLYTDYLISPLAQRPPLAHRACSTARFPTIKSLTFWLRRPKPVPICGASTLPPQARFPPVAGKSSQLGLLKLLCFTTWVRLYGAWDNGGLGLGYP
jgi:hypothetical protein